jgi:D-glycero-D-manno-heptose 1,7-bisphosphate phosphatase
MLARHGLGLIVVTNQSGLARGYFDADQLAKIHACLNRLLAAENVALDAIYFCPHVPEDECACRKPRRGMVDQAVARYGFDPGESFVVGDKACDMELGQTVGATSILVRTGHGRSFSADRCKAPDHVVDDLSAAAQTIITLLGRRPIEQLEYIESATRTATKELS